MTLKELVQAELPRLVISFMRGHDGSENFQWGVVGSIPVLSLLGHLTQAQNRLTTGQWMQEYGEEAPPAFVMVWMPEVRDAEFFRHPDVPEIPLCGMIETIKSAIVASRMAQHMASQRVTPRILGIDGNPIRHVDSA